MSRTGYTLIELLIVLAILAALSALIQPSVRGVLDKSRLSAAAGQVQAALAKSRALAIREGVPVWFRFETGGQQWWIERDSTAQPLTDSLAASPIMAPQPESTVDDTATHQGSSVVILRSGQLPEGVVFPDSAAGHSERVCYSPTGRTTSGSLRLTGQRQFVVELTIRGLTGLARTAPPVRLPATASESMGGLATEASNPTTGLLPPPQVQP